MTEQEIQKWVESHEWTFAKTYAHFAPHEYIVRTKLSTEDSAIFGEIFQHIYKNGEDEMLFKRNWRVMFIGDYKYWFYSKLLDDGQISRCEEDGSWTTISFEEGKNTELIMNRKPEKKDLNKKENIITPNQYTKEQENEKKVLETIENIKQVIDIVEVNEVDIDLVDNLFYYINRLELVTGNSRIKQG